MSLRSRLARLSSAPFPEEIRVDPPPAATGDRAALLDDLRERIRATLERSARRAVVSPPPVDTVDLPFVTTDTPLGPLHVRATRLSPAHRTGRAQIYPARSADTEVLSLLALDPRVARCNPARALYLDTETTGLSGGTGTIAFLVGLAWWERTPESGRPQPQALVLEQILVRNLGEEAPMLERVRERIEDAELLVTFNGKSFDLPLLRTRFVMARAAAPAEPPHLDLLHVARRVHKQRAHGQGCRLVALEREVLGFERSDDVESRDVSACYLHFLRTGDARGLLAVVEHNAWDVVAMAALVGLYGAPLHEGLAAEDLVGVARTMRRAGSLDRAREVADVAVERQTSPESLRARADIAKALGERDRALADFEAIARLADDPAARLELAKIYEHSFKSPAKALAWAGRGTGEAPVSAQRRLARLARKVAKAEATLSREPPSRQAAKRARAGESTSARERRSGARRRGEGVAQDLQGILDVALRDDQRRRDP
ncbi:MAG: ribonuclease H-like domain-containing protein [Polyangiaceae bacterium]